jgi:hypothetical protein
VRAHVRLQTLGSDDTWRNVGATKVWFSTLVDWSRLASG